MCSGDDEMLLSNICDTTLVLTVVRYRSAYQYHSKVLCMGKGKLIISTTVDVNSHFPHKYLQVH